MQFILQKDSDKDGFIVEMGKREDVLSISKPCFFGDIEEEEVVKV
jgi:hypothetical protein